jgi:putative membrane protein
MKKELTSYELAIKRTKLANERTYLAYMRTGFGIAALAGVFKKWWIVIFGLIILILSTVQYHTVNNQLNNKETPNTPILELLPIIYVVLGLLILFLQWKKI